MYKIIKVIIYPNPPNNTINILGRLRYSPMDLGINVSTSELAFIKPPPIYFWESPKGRTPIPVFQADS